MMISKDRYKEQLAHWLNYYKEHIQFINRFSSGDEKSNALIDLSQKFDTLVKAVHGHEFVSLERISSNLVYSALTCYRMKQPHTTLDQFFSPCEDILLRKNADYAGATDPYRNFRRCQQYNIPLETGIIVRMCDKISRIENLLQPDVVEQVKDEKVTDTLIDLVNYTAILCTWLENTYRRELFSS